MSFLFLGFGRFILPFDSESNLQREKKFKLSYCTVLVAAGVKKRKVKLERENLPN